MSGDCANCGICANIVTFEICFLNCCDKYRRFHNCYDKYRTLTKYLRNFYVIVTKYLRNFYDIYRKLDAQISTVAQISSFAHQVALQAFVTNIWAPTLISVWPLCVMASSLQVCQCTCGTESESCLFMCIHRLTCSHNFRVSFRESSSSNIDSCFTQMIVR